jgi:hypothetical protein
MYHFLPMLWEVEQCCSMAKFSVYYYYVARLAATLATPEYRYLQRGVAYSPQFQAMKLCCLLLYDYIQAS